MNRIIDHIVYCVPDLDQAVEELESLLGVRPQIGGRHLNNGTKNALLNVGNGCYLELLAKDENNQFFEGDRWMGIDLIDNPKITRWSLKSEDLDKDCNVLKTYDHSLATTFRGSRKTTDGSMLKWGMSLPKATPEIEVIPFFTDWSDSAYHPTDRMEEKCELIDIQLFHPNPDLINEVLRDLDVDLNVISSENAKIQIKIKSPTGVHLLT